MVKFIPLTQGQFTEVDDNDYEWLTQWKWSADAEYTPAGKIFYRVIRNDHRKILRIHRVIMEKMLGRSLLSREIVDHRDNNPLNNTRNNLRLAGSAENQYNRSINANSKSGFKGVSWHAQSSKWLARIRTPGKVHYLGTYEKVEDAALVYDDAARELHGEFARLNFPNKGEQKA